MPECFNMVTSDHKNGCTSGVRKDKRINPPIKESSIHQSRITYILLEKKQYSNFFTTVIARWSAAVLDMNDVR